MNINILFKRNKKYIIIIVITISSLLNKINIFFCFNYFNG